MADDKIKTAAERKSIDVNEPYELSYWSAKLGVSRERIEETVKKVGPKVEDVAREVAGLTPLNPGSERDAKRRT